jgi:hypothetical protein
MEDLSLKYTSLTKFFFKFFGADMLCLQALHHPVYMPMHLRNTWTRVMIIIVTDFDIRYPFVCQLTCSALQIFIILYIYIYIYMQLGARCSVVVKALCYKPEDSGFDNR